MDIAALNPIIKISPRYKRISLYISPKGELAIRSPKNLNAGRIAQILHDAQPWIVKHWKPLIQASPLADGAEIFIFGDPEKLRYMPLESSRAKVEDAGSELHIKAAPGKHSDVLKNWLKKVAKQGIENRVKELAEQFNFSFNRVSVRDQGTRWGSCSTRKNLNFSWRLALAPLAVMDYVIVHELAHTKQMNHSQNFWDLVAQCIPDYQTHIRWLKENGKLLHSY